MKFPKFPNQKYQLMDEQVESPNILYQQHTSFHLPGNKLVN